MPKETVKNNSLKNFSKQLFSRKNVQISNILFKVKFPKTEDLRWKILKYRRFKKYENIKQERAYR